MATGDLAFWEALAARGLTAEAALAAYAQHHAKAEVACLEARYARRELFAFERTLAYVEGEPAHALGQAEWVDAAEGLSVLCDAEQKLLNALLNARWRWLAIECDLAPRLPHALYDLWSTPDGLDMRAFLRAKNARITLERAIEQAFPPRNVASAIRYNDRRVTDRCRGLAAFALATRTERHDIAMILPQAWHRDGDDLVSDDPRFFNVPIDAHIAESLVEHFVMEPNVNDNHFWELKTFRADHYEDTYVFVVPEPNILRETGRVAASVPRQRLCPPADDLLRAGLYHRDDDMDGCLPDAIFAKLRAAAEASERRPDEWWSRAALDRALRACKPSRPARAALVAAWAELDAAVRAPGALHERRAALRDAVKRATRSMGLRDAPDRPIECAPADLATWLAKAAHDTLPTKDKHTDLDAWVARAEVQRAIDRCAMTSDEAVRVRMLWVDLDAIVRSGAARDTKEASMKDALHAFRYDRPPWSMAQRRTARALSDQSLRKL